MTPWLQDPDVTLYYGDVLGVLRELPDESVDCCVTSPPYWGLRDYGQEGQLGLEPTPEEYVTRMVEVFREVRRVLAPHGTVWLNLGDSYNANQGKGFNGQVRQDHANRHTVMPRVGFKPKDLVGIPWRVAFALQADGWYLRSDIIWAKPNPMPESVTDRPTKAHEYVFLLSKQSRYFFDQEAVREPAVYFGPNGGPDTMDGSANARRGEMKGRAGAARRKPLIPNQTIAGVGTQGLGSETFGHYAENGRNIRSVWEIATQPYPEAHFATFPEELARRCIAAGCPEQVCAECGKPWVSIVEVESRRRDVVGVEPTCDWPDTRPGVTLDPFIGSGTVAHVARKLGRHAVGIDLNESYLELAARRLQQQSLFAGTA